MMKPISIRSLPVRWAAEPSFVPPIKRQSVLSWLCSLRESGARNRQLDVVGRPFWIKGDKQTKGGVRLHRNAGSFWNNSPSQGEGI